MSTYMVIDIETQDNYIAMDMGSGWVYAYHNYPSSVYNYKLLCVGVFYHDDLYGSWYDCLDLQTLQYYLDRSDFVVAHNAQYDVGGLMAYGVRFNCPVYDTMLIGSLLQFQRTSLQFMAEQVIGESEGKISLGWKAWEKGLYPLTKKQQSQLKKGETIEPPPLKKLDKWAYKNMEYLYKNIPYNVTRYCLYDIYLTNKLFCKLHKFIEDDKFDTISTLTYACLDMRRRGIRVDIAKAEKSLDDIRRIKQEKTTKAHEEAGREFNLYSSQEVASVLLERGLDLPKTELGNFSATSPWLQKQDDKLCQYIVEAKKADKIDNDFIRKLICLQPYTTYDNAASGYGRVHPELHMYRAKTGRFSCTAYNIQQIPKRDPYYGPLMRSLFVAEEGESFFSLDYENQEGRLQVHFAKRLGCKDGDYFVQKFNEDPDFDMHQQVADMMHISRREAKTVNLGISYGMGEQTLASQLNQSNKEAKKLLKNYHKRVPFLKELDKVCKERAERRGYIKTLKKRKLYVEKYNGVCLYYKMLNKLIQGSATDQIIESICQAYKAGIPILMPVHDELIMSSSYDQAYKLKNIMENCIKLEIPSVVDMSAGSNWNQ